MREEITSTGDADYDSETRFALDWFAAKGFEKGASGDAITMTNAVNVSLDGMNAAGFFEASGGDARLLKRDELPDELGPGQDSAARSGKLASTSSSGSPPKTAASTPLPPSTIAWARLPSLPTRSPAASTISASRSSGLPRAGSTISFTRNGM